MEYVALAFAGLFAIAGIVAAGAIGANKLKDAEIKNLKEKLEVSEASNSQSKNKLEEVAAFYKRELAKREGEPSTPDAIGDALDNIFNSNGN